MRHRRLRACSRSIVAAAALIGLVSGLAPSAMAQVQYDRLFIFGDSYADLTLANPTATGQPGLSLWNVYPISLGKNLEIPTLVDFAVGGATASPAGAPALPPFWNLPQQVDNFIAGGGTIGPNDLVTLNIGGNDIRAILLNSASANQAFGYPNATINPLNRSAA
jgi:outer membrane lipase/esterase